MKYFIKVLFFTLAILLSDSGLKAESGIKWQDWSDLRFTEAKKQNKLIYLNLEAVWCHWCHVMAKETYSKPEIIEALNKSFISIKVDQDSYPDLSLRYRDYGWPATIIFNSNGEEIEKMSGFVEPQALLKVLKSSVENPAPKNKHADVELEYRTDTSLEKSYREKLTNSHYSSMDMEIGGLRTAHRFLDFETLELALSNSAKGSVKDIEFSKLSLNSNQKLIDPIWGGVYQYSARYNWDNPHYEKIMQSQTDNIKLYSYAYSLWGDEQYWTAATNIYRYVKTFLTSPEGAFYTSQDADLIKGKHSKDYFKLSDAERRKLGIPSVDKNIYARENGWMISALTALYASTGNQAMLDDAIKAANWILQHRKLPAGGFSHGEADKQGPFLGDTLSMSQAFLSLYSVTGDKGWLTKSQESAEFLTKNFLDTNTGAPGYFSAKLKSGSVLKPYKDLTENIQTARLLNLIYHYSGDKKYKEAAKSAMQYAASPVSAPGYINNSGILTADIEFNSEPLHITIVGQKNDPASKALFQSGLKYFSVYKRLEWWDKSEGAMPNPDVEYPQMPKPAAFICTNKRCSLPIFKPEGIPSTIKLFHKDEK